MALVRVATLPTGEQVSQLLSRLERLEKALSEEGGGDAGGDGGARTTGGGTPASREPHAAEPSVASSRGASSAAASQALSKPPSQPKSKPKSKAKPKPEPHEESPDPAATAARPTPRPAQAGASNAAAAGAPLPVVLDRLRAFARERDRGLSTSLDNVTLVESRPGHLKLSTQQPFHHRRLSDRLQAVEQICSDFFGEATRVDLLPPANSEEAPIAEGPSPRREHERQQRREALEHPSVNLALELLDAEIIDIVPVGGK
jgi:hypothetical protein